MTSSAIENHNNLDLFARGLSYNPLPENKGRDPNIPHAPHRSPNFSVSETKLAISNALRYFPRHLHATLSNDFYDELVNYGHIYMYRFKPPHSIMKAHSIYKYPARTKEGAAIMLMITNNLDRAIAQYPEELVTYGGNGQVFSNWAQFWIVMRLLSRMTSEQCLVLYSGHPMGLYPIPSNSYSPRLVITNGMMIPSYSDPVNYNKLFGLGVTQYGQMTAGSFCYIGPQGIVHGTTITVMNAIRQRIGRADWTHTKKVFVTSGLGGMSGAQPKAAVIADCIGVVAEVSEEALMKRYNQGWLLQVGKSVKEVIDMINQALIEDKATSIGYLGNIVDLWEGLVDYHKVSGELLVDIGSDQTSCHILTEGGYFPVELTYSKSLEMIKEDPDQFKLYINRSLIRQIEAINYLTDKGMYFFDYGNAFLFQAGNAGADVFMEEIIGDNNGAANVSSGNSILQNKFRYPSYVQDIMGDIFSMGFGPFRWICTSGNANDLEATDQIAESVLTEIIKEITDTKEGDSYYNKVKLQYEDNLKWIQNAGYHKLVVGSQARILYADTQGRIRLAKAFNDAVKSGRVSSPIVLSRDHHDVSGADSPFRETSNVYDGSAVCADMAIHNVIGDSFRGATWVAIHNGGGTGWGRAINGGFGLVLTGSSESSKQAEQMLGWDVANGLSRRSWAGNEFAIRAVEELSQEIHGLELTMPYADTGF